MHPRKKWLIYISAVALAPFWCVVAGLAISSRVGGNGEAFFVALTILGVITIIVWLLLELISITAAITNDGVVAWSLRGQELLPWNKVTRLRIVPSMIIIEWPHKRLNLLLTFYNNPVEIVEFIQRIVPANVRE